MSETDLRAGVGPSLATRIQTTVFSLTLSAYLIGLLMIGIPLREMTAHNLSGNAEQEVNALSVALQHPAAQHNYSAIEQVLIQCTGRV